MEITEIKRTVIREEYIPKEAEKNVTLVKFNYNFDETASTDENSKGPDRWNRLIDLFSLDELKKIVLGEQKDWRLDSKEFTFMRTGWQAWDCGWESFPKHKIPKFIPLLAPLKNYITVPGSSKPGRNVETGQFIVWLRWGSAYLVVASVGQRTPPVQYLLNRKNETLGVEVASVGKNWTQGETVAELCCFFVDNYFLLKEVINHIYFDKRFKAYDLLGKKPGGFETWYNHYNLIDEKLVLEDLYGLKKNNNFVNQYYIKGKRPVIYQVDDGWQIATGDWDVNLNRFPGGLTSLSEKIKKEGFIPGLWIAPFVIDYRCSLVKEHPDWVLKNEKGKPIPAGLNIPWSDFCGKNQPGFPYSYYVLDLSNDDVIEHIKKVMNRVVNEWGFRYLKLDFLFAGVINGAFKNKGCSYQWYYRALDTVTAIDKADNGEKVLYLGCGMPFEMSYKNLPLSRIGADTREAWETGYLKRMGFPGRPGAYTSMKDTLAHSFWNKSVYLNDPDVVFFRSENCQLSENEKETLALVDYLFGSQIMVSDDPSGFNPLEEGVFTEKILNYYDMFENEEFGNIELSPDIYVIFSKSGDFCGVVNLSNKSFPIMENDLATIADVYPSEERMKIFLESGKKSLFNVVQGNPFVAVTNNTVLYSCEKHSMFILQKEK